MASSFFGRFLCRFLTNRIIKTPYMADSITQGTLASWEKKIGDFVAQDETVASIETDKVTIPVNAPESGTLREQFVKEGDTVQVGSDLFKLELGTMEQKKSNQPSNDDIATATTKIINENSSKESNEKGGKFPNSKSNEKRKESSIEKENKITENSNTSSTIASNSMNSIPNSISFNGIEAMKSKDNATNLSAYKASSPSPSAASSSTSERLEVTENLSRMRLRIAERMKQSQEINAALTTFNEVDMHSVMAMRSKYKDLFSEKNDGLKLGFMSVFVKACAKALWEWPIINARMNLETKEIIYHNYVDISVAVATPKVYFHSFNYYFC